VVVHLEKFSTQRHSRRRYSVPDRHDGDIVSQVEKQDDAYEIMELKKLAALSAASVIRDGYGICHAEQSVCVRTEAHTTKPKVLGKKKALLHK
jgi:hypothetical protein